MFDDVFEPLDGGLVVAGLRLDSAEGRLGGRPPIATAFLRGGDRERNWLQRIVTTGLKVGADEDQVGPRGLGRVRGFEQLQGFRIVATGERRTSAFEPFRRRGGGEDGDEEEQP